VGFGGGSMSRLGAGSVCAIVEGKVLVAGVEILVGDPSDGGRVIGPALVGLVGEEVAMIERRFVVVERSVDLQLDKSCRRI
jgi:hypothetical protein